MFLEGKNSPLSTSKMSFGTASDHCHVVTENGNHLLMLATQITQ